MKKYKPFFKIEEKSASLQSNLTTTMEFFLREGKLWVTYNGITVTMKDFLNKNKFPESQVIMDLIYERIVNKYNSLPTVAYAIHNNENRSNIILNFITEYFAKNKNPLDVIIKNSGEIIMNLEHEF